MGKVMSMATKPLRSFNIENRAARAMDRHSKGETPKAAPLHKTTKIGYEKLARENPQLREIVKSKNEALHERLRQVRVESTGPPPEESLVSKRALGLPLTKEKVDDFEFGYLIPDVIPEGRVSIKQVFEFIGQHQNDPKGYTAAMVAKDYKLDPVHVEHILKYFQSFNMYVPKKIRDKVKATPEEIDMMARPPQVLESEKETPQLQAESPTPEKSPEVKR